MVKLYGFSLSIAYIARRRHPYIESGRLSDTGLYMFKTATANAIRGV